MIEVRQTAEFRSWFASIADNRAKTRIGQRIARVEIGLLGDVRSVGSGVSELRVDYGPGYRVYFCRRGEAVVLLLCGGDKSTQTSDIRSAKALVKQVGE